MTAGAGAVWTVDRRRHLVEIDPDYRRVTWLKALPATRPSIGLAVSAVPEWPLAVGSGAVWVTDGSPRLTRVDLRTRRVSQIDVRRLLDGVAVYRGAVWVCSGPTASVLPIDPADPAHPQRVEIVAHARTGSPYLVEIEAGFGAIWTVKANTADVTRIDADTRRVIATIPIGVEHQTPAPPPWQQPGPRRTTSSRSR